MSNAKLRQLQQILERQKELYKGYKFLAEEQRRQLVNHNLENLNEVNIQIDECIQNIQELESQRIFVVEELSRTEDRTFKRIAEICDHFEDDYSPLLRETYLELKEVLSAVAYANGINRKLIQNSREFIRSSIAIVTGFTSLDKNNKFKTYGENGKIGSPKNQAYRLMNREV